MQCDKDRRRDVKCEEFVIKEESLSGDDGWDNLSGNTAVVALPTYRVVPVLTNLQRGNIQTEESVLVPEQMNWFVRAAMGEIIAQDLITAQQKGYEQEILHSTDKSGLTPLCWAAYYGQLPTVELLLNYQADIEHESDDGHTALLMSCMSGHHDVAKLLLTHGAQPDHADHMGCTALMFAAASDHAHCVAVLLEQGASFSATNVAGSTAYMLAVRRKATKAQAVLERYLQRLLEPS